MNKEDTVHRQQFTGTPSRREFLSRAGGGCGMLALASLLQEEQLTNAAGATAGSGAGRTRSVIWLFMNGGPSGIDLFDHKPELRKWDGKSFPEKIETLFPYPGPVMQSPYTFQKYGECGATVSDVYPHLARHVDKLTFLNACRSDAQNHVPACYMVNSGMTRVGAPCVGSWLTYGLGRSTRDLPGFVVMHDPRSAPEGGANLWDAGFLPGEHQGVMFRPSKHPILYLKRPDDLSRSAQTAQLELLRKLNGRHLGQHPAETQMQARIESFETAFRMQSSAGRLVDVSQETGRTQQLYGMDDPECRAFGNQLLMARRMVEDGVRFIQIYHGGFESNWDQHANLEIDHRQRCHETDKPIAGLLTDLQQRGLLDSTLVIWGGEFGRTPTSQDRNGRDHNPFGFTMWMAGGGAKPGLSYGKTDEFGYRPVENSVSMHDLHATILHLAGLNHEELTFFHDGRHQSLTNNRGSIIHDIVA